MSSPITIRPILPSDDPVIADIIRRSLEEFGANRCGTVYYDVSTDHLYGLFSGTPRSAYFIAQKKDEILGGAGIFPTEGLDIHTCELVKMYLKKEARGLGLGKRLIEHCLSVAKDMGYRQVYLETMPELQKAVSIYEKFGFHPLHTPLGNTGHTGCGIWMLKTLEDK